MGEGAGFVITVTVKHTLFLGKTETADAYKFKIYKKLKNNNKSCETMWRLVGVKQLTKI